MSDKVRHALFAGNQVLAMQLINQQRMSGQDTTSDHVTYALFAGNQASARELIARRRTHGQDTSSDEVTYALFAGNQASAMQLINQRRLRAQEGSVGPYSSLSRDRTLSRRGISAVPEGRPSSPLRSAGVPAKHHLDAMADLDNVESDLLLIFFRYQKFLEARDEKGTERAVRLAEMQLNVEIDFRETRSALYSGDTAGAIRVLSQRIYPVTTEIADLFGNDDA